MPKSTRRVIRYAFKLSHKEIKKVIWEGTKMMKWLIPVKWTLPTKSFKPNSRAASKLLKKDVFIIFFC